MHERRLRTVRAGIYVIECSVTGQFYVGSSSNLDERKACHWVLLRSGKHCNSRMQEAWMRHGECSFTFRLLEVVGDLALRRQAERRYAEELSAASPGLSLTERLPAPSFDPSTGLDRWVLSDPTRDCCSRYESNASWVKTPQ